VTKGEAVELVVAAVQLSSGSNSARNVDDAERLVRVAADQGARYIQVPEYFNFLGPFSGFDAAAEEIPGPTTRRMAELARSLGVTVHLGSLLERSAEEGKYFNTSVVLGASGDILATYRKIHLFDVNVPDAITHRESEIIAPGDEMVVVRSAGFGLGLSVCFDVRFPELYRQLALAGADVIAIPAAFNAVTGRAHWHQLVRTRAIENHVFVVAAAQAGTTTEGIATFGHSLVVDPWGDVMAESLSDGPDVLVATLDLDDVARRRSQIAVMEFRRPDLYAKDVRVVDE
jgi:predicted amidohydrolase